MCGIGLILSGIRINLSSILLHTPSPPTTAHLEPSQEPLVFIHHLKTALQRRGPDSLGSKKLLLCSRFPCSVGEPLLLSAIEDGSSENGNGYTNLVPNSVAELHFVGATLQLRGVNPIAQPFVDPSGNILIYNGEIFGGVEVGRDCNDGEVLLQSLGNCCSYNSSVTDVLSRIMGPWAVIYWQATSRTLWFGRDAFGRRSLLVHWPNAKDSRFLLSSVSPFSPVDRGSGI